MKLTKLLSTAGVMLATAALVFTTAASAAPKTPAEICAEVTGKTIQEVITIRKESGKTYGTIAKDEGVLDEFKEGNYEAKKERVEDKVNNGQISRDEADKLLGNLNDRQENCDGTGSGGAGLGLGNGNGNGAGNGIGNGDGSCLEDGTRPGTGVGNGGSPQGGGRNGGGRGNGASNGIGNNVGNGGQGSDSGRGNGGGGGRRDGSCVA